MVDPQIDALLHEPVAQINGRLSMVELDLGRFWYEMVAGGLEDLDDRARCEQVLEMADGRLFSGRQAIGNGLIDAEGNIEDAIAAAGRMADLGDDPYVLRPPKPRIGLLDLLLQGRSNLVGRVLGAGDALHGPTLKFVPSY